MFRSVRDTARSPDAPRERVGSLLEFQYLYNDIDVSLGRGIVTEAREFGGTYLINTVTTTTRHIDWSISNTIRS